MKAMRTNPNGITMIKDDLPRVLSSIASLTKKQVLVGIPDSNTNRQQVTPDPITNAALGYIHEFGEPSQNIPARPFLIPGVQKALPTALRILQQAADAALDGNSGQADRLLHRVGLLASAMTKKEIMTANFAPLRPSTIRNRRFSRGTASMRQSEKDYAVLLQQAADQQGLHPELLSDSELKAAESAVGIQPLINTGALRDSLTYVVRKA